MVARMIVWDPLTIQKVFILGQPHFSCDPLMTLTRQISGFEGLQCSFMSRNKTFRPFGSADDNEKVQIWKSNFILSVGSWPTNFFFRDILGTNNQMCDLQTLTTLIGLFLANLESIIFLWNNKIKYPISKSYAILSIRNIFSFRFLVQKLQNVYYRNN